MRWQRFVPGVALALAGLVIYALASGSVAGTAISIALMGVGGVWVVAAAFYEIGASEDRDRHAGRS